MSLISFPSSFASSSGISEGIRHSRNVVLCKSKKRQCQKLVNEGGGTAFALARFSAV